MRVNLATKLLELNPNVPLLYAVVNDLKITKTNKDGF